MSNATGSDQVNVLPDGAATLLVWLSVPTLFVVTRHRSRSRSATMVVAACAMSVGFTLWIVRPQAPDGSDFDKSYEEITADLERDVAQGLGEVAPGRWSPIEATEEPSPCVDRFGRDRGAVYGGRSYEIDGVLSPGELRRLAAAVAAPDREVQAPALGTPIELLGQDHDLPVVQVRNEQRYDAATVSIVTPCLRSAERR